MAVRTIAKSLGIIFLLCILCVLVDFSHINPDDTSLLSCLDSFGYAAWVSISNGITGHHLEPAEHDLLIVNLQTRLFFVSRLTQSWSTLWSIPFLLTLIIVQRYRNRLPNRTVCAIILGTGTGLLGLFTALIAGAFLTSGFSPLWWLTGCITGCLAGAGLSYRLPEVLVKWWNRPCTGLSWLGWICLPLSIFICAYSSYLSLNQITRHRPEHPNLLLIVVDTLRADGLGICGSTFASSPQIDSFFKSELQMTGLRSDSSWTAPSFASLFTGLGPALHGVVQGFHHLPTDTETLAGFLKRRGYTTCALMCNPVVPESNGYGNGFDLYINRIDRREARDTLSGALALIPLLKARQNFFMVIQFMDCHNPYTPSFPYDLRSVHRRFDTRIPPPVITEDYKNPELDMPVEPVDAFRVRYQMALRDADRALGSILRGFQKQGLLNNTLVVLVSDHGEEFREHGSLDHCATVYEESVRIPCLMRFPGGARTGTTGNRVRHGVLQRHGLISDLGTTLLQSMNYNANLGAGINLFNAADKTRPLFIETRRLGFPIKAVVMDDYKYIAPLDPVDTPP
ncbi:MAG TPA: sulfatase, partial [bacterium]|nr:sulfatase [bacterium]